ncbi:MAG: NAD(P)H-hydrate dehydratase [Patescibacteria group bacterium]
MKLIIQNKLLFPEILKKWPRDIHKKQRAKIMIIAGFQEMIGAAALTTLAAYRVGAGIVMLAVPGHLEKYYRQVPLECLILPCPQTREGSISLKAEKLILEKSVEYDVVILGPGLSKNRETQKLVQRLVVKLKKPLILDADGLNAMVGKISLFRRRKFPTILTPHEGEMARLCEVSAQKIHKNREKFASQKAKEWSVVLVLKGYQTIIANNNVVNSTRSCKNDNIVIINRSGGPSLATAGTGDVLSGVIAVLWAENLKNPVKAAATAVFLHGNAGDKAAKKLGERSVMASDVIKYLPEVIQKTSKHNQSIILTERKNKTKI